MGNTDHDESVRIIDRASDAGINFVDTGPNTVAYTPPALSEAGLRRRPLPARSAA